MSKAKWIVMISIPAVVLIIVASILYIQQMNKPKKVVEAFVTAVEQNEPDGLQNVILPDDEKALVDKATLQALVTYLKANNSSYQAIKDHLQEQVENKDYTMSGQQISLVENGKQWGMFPNYKLKVKTLSIKVTGQNEDDKVKVSIKNFKKSLNKKEEATFGPVLPGTYEIITTVNNQLGTFLKEEKVDVWGSSEQVTLVLDSNKLVQEDQGIQQTLLKEIEMFNHDISEYQTSGFNIDVFSNITEEMKKDSSIIENDFNVVKEYIDQISSQYLGAVVNLDELETYYFNNQWSADVQASVSYKYKTKYRNIDKVNQKSYTSIRSYSLIYDESSKKWIIDNILEKESDGSEVKRWDNKEEIKSDYPVLKWNRVNSTEAF